MDLTSDDEHQYDIIDDFADDLFAVCRGRLENDFSLNDILKIGTTNKGIKSDITLVDILIERLENDVVVRSRNCSYIVRNVGSGDRKVCDVCRRLLCDDDFDINTSSGRPNDDDDVLMNDASDDSSSDVFKSVSSESSVVENVSKSNETSVLKTSAMLDKIKALNLPVTVSLTDKPKRSHFHFYKLCTGDSKETFSDESLPVKKPAPRFATVKNDSNVIEMAGKTVTNRCSWCGEVFHRLYLFMDHLKVHTCITSISFVFIVKVKS